MPLAHVAGLPLEELVPALGGTGGLLLIARGWLALRLRRLRGAAAAPAPASAPGQGRDRGR